MFVTLPIAFAEVPFGTISAVAFFVLLLLAAIASAISMLEMPVALIRGALGFSRAQATLVSAGVCWIAGFASVLSFNLWSGWFPLAAVPSLARATIFDLLDHLTSNVMLPTWRWHCSGLAPPTRFLVEELRLGHVATAILRALLATWRPAPSWRRAFAPIAA